jgi:DNA-binding response OmpR family regulator
MQAGRRLVIGRPKLARLAQNGQRPEQTTLRILIVEDNPDIVANLVAFLRPQGHEVVGARTGPAGLSRAREGTFDAVVLDLGLPGMDGLEVCRRLRQEQRVHRVSTPILMLTARDSLQDKVLGFDVGADDYLVKPFSVVELELRLKALVRRALGSSSPSVFRFADATLDLSTLEATRAGLPVRLTPTGYKLLAILLREAPNLVRRETLEEEVWGKDRPESDALRTHIHSLRLALDKPFATPLLKTVPGLGYRLVQPDD